MPGAEAEVTTVVWTFAAIADVQEIRRYIDTFNPQAARTMAEAIIEAAESLAEFPNRGRPVPRTRMKELTFIRPYVIRYRVDGKRVTIMPVRHSRQRPLDA